MNIILKFSLRSIGDVYDIIEENVGEFDNLYQSEIDKIFTAVETYIYNQDTIFINFNTKTNKFRIMKIEEVQKKDSSKL